MSKKTKSSKKNPKTEMEKSRGKFKTQRKNSSFRRIDARLPSKLIDKKPAQKECTLPGKAGFGK